MQWESNYNLGVRPDAAEMFESGIAYIIIPSDVDRDVYIRECYRTKTVSIYSEFNGVSNRVPIDLFSLNFVKFPNDVKELGSAVHFSIDPVRKAPYITAIYFKTDELADLAENQFKFKRELNGNFVEISGSPSDKYLGLTVKSDKGGDLLINVGSEDETGKLTITVEGDVNITSTANTTLKQFNGFSTQTINKENEHQYSLIEQTDEEVNIKADKISFDTDTFKINGGEENMVLGQKLKSFFDDLISELGKTTVTTALGQMPILNKAQVEAFKLKTDTFLSEVGFINR